MKTRRKRSMTAMCGVLLCVASTTGSAAYGADSEPVAPRRFTATAEFSEPGSGTRTIQVGIVVDRVISEREAKGLIETLKVGGQGALRSAILNRASGRLTLGVVQYPLNIITAKPTANGIRYAIVTVRRIKIHERDTGQPSLEYPFAVAVFEVDKDGRGEGDLYRTAALRVDGSGQVEVEDFHGAPGRLRRIEPQR